MITAVVIGLVFQLDAMSFSSAGRHIDRRC